MRPKALSPDFLRRINPQPHRLGFASTPAPWSDIQSACLRTWFLCMQSGSTLHVETANRRWELPGATGIFVPPGTAITRFAPDGGTRHWITFDWDDRHPVDPGHDHFYGPAGVDRARLRPAPRWVPAEVWLRPIPLPGNFFESFLRLNERFWHGTPASRAASRGLLLELMIDVLGGLTEWPVTAAPGEQAAEERLLEALRAAAEAPFSRAPSIESLLVATGQSHDHVARRFRRAYGLTPLDYLNRLRVERAKGLLQDTDLGVNEIARRLGFADFRYFTRLFRRVTGRLPRDHRRAFTRTLSAAEGSPGTAAQRPTAASPSTGSPARGAASARRRPATA